MTMKLTIRNEDQSRVAEVAVEEFKVGNSIPVCEQTEVLEPGKSVSFWIHASKRLVVTENPNASRPATEGRKEG